MKWDVYRECGVEPLSQGDILDPSPLTERLLGHQDYFANSDRFVHYAVLTQSCDLERESSRSHFILLAVVRRLSEAYSVRDVEPGAWSGFKKELRDVLGHQYNKRGFFYLPANKALGLVEDSVIDLRVMFSVHKSHYSALVAARRGGMTDIYAAQLGHMIGHMFSRVALPGWADPDDLNRVAKDLAGEFKRRADDHLDALKRQQGDVCLVKGCGKPVETYRWVRIEGDDGEPVEQDLAFCRTHALEHDNGTFNPDQQGGWLPRTSS